MELKPLKSNSRKHVLLPALSEQHGGNFGYLLQSNDNQGVPVMGQKNSNECLKLEERKAYDSCSNFPVSENNGKKTDETDKKDNLLSDVEGLMLLIPYYIGLGFLGLPYMVKLLGLWAGLCGLLFCGFLNEICILILVDSTRCLMKRTGERLSDIVSVAEMSMKLGPPCLRPHAVKYKWMTKCALILNHFLFLADMLSLMSMFANDLFGEIFEMDSHLTVVVISVSLIPVYLARNMKLLVRMATLANIVLLGIVAISFQYICRDLPDVSSRVAAKPTNYLTLVTFSNDVMFTLDGIGVVLPVRDRMKSTQHFDGWNGILGVALMFVTCFHAACGFYGYLKFGEVTHVMYLLNLPLYNWLYKSLKILFLVSLYCTTGVVVFVPVDICWGRMRDRFTSTTIQNYGEYILRFILLVAVCIFTLSIPEFKLLMSLTGCLWTYIGTVIVPASVKLMLSYDEMTPLTRIGKLQRQFTLILCYILLIFGIYSTVSGIVVTLYMTFI